MLYLLFERLCHLELEWRRQDTMTNIANTASHESIQQRKRLSPRYQGRSREKQTGRLSPSGSAFSMLEYILARAWLGVLHTEHGTLREVRVRLELKYTFGKGQILDI